VGAKINPRAPQSHSKGTQRDKLYINKLPINCLRGRYDIQNQTGHLIPRILAITLGSLSGTTWRPTWLRLIRYTNGILPMHILLIASSLKGMLNKTYPPTSRASLHRRVTDRTHSTHAASMVSKASIFLPGFHFLVQFRRHTEISKHSTKSTIIRVMQCKIAK